MASDEDKYFSSNKYEINRSGRRIQKADDPKTKDVDESNESLFSGVYVDGSDALANKGFVVGFHHVPSGEEVYLKAFLTTFNETFSPDWTEETVYGRADAIYLFKQTKRNLTVGLKIPAGSKSEAFGNLAKVQKLIQFLYPNYSQVNSGQTISQSPLIRLQVMNLVANQNASAGIAQNAASPFTPAARTRANPEAGETFETLLGRGADASTGLLGVLKNLNIVHNLEGDQGAIEIAGGAVLPKNIEINFDFAAIHEHHLGWDAEGNFSNESFPYGVNATTGFTKKQLEAMANSANTRFKAETATQQNIANAEARYAGAMGGMRSRRDARRLDRTRLDTESREYLQSAQAGRSFLEGEDTQDLVTETGDGSLLTPDDYNY